MVSAWSQRPDTSVPVLAIRDNPDFGEAPVACVSEDPESAAMRCAKNESDVLFDDGKAAAVAQDPNATLIDLTPYYCTADGMCPAVIGNVVVYRDAHHLTRTYATTVGPYLADKLAAALGDSSKGNA